MYKVFKGLRENGSSCRVTSRVWILTFKVCLFGGILRRMKSWGEKSGKITFLVVVWLGGEREKKRIKENKGKLEERESHKNKNQRKKKTGKNNAKKKKKKHLAHVQVHMGNLVSSHLELFSPQFSPYFGEKAFWWVQG